MTGLEFQPITQGNLDLVVRLLHQRDRTLPAYTRWKYGHGHGSDFNGVVVTRGGEPVGCFGLIVRQLRVAENTIPCGWFADWYVAADNRTHGVGTEMLRYISRSCPIVFGHPGPKKAQKTCLANGYHPLKFQSRRRLICKRYAYERSRTRHPVKAAAKVPMAWMQSAKSRREGLSRMETIGSNRDSLAAAFVSSEGHRDWIFSQPVRPGISRHYGAWQSEGLEVLYFDDELPESGRRRILFTSGPGQYSEKTWRRFAEESSKADCRYMELFTTDVALDAVWEALGAYSHAEPPVLVHVEVKLGMPIILHGWDRENWTFLANQPSPVERSPSPEDISAIMLSNDYRGVKVSVVIATYRRRRALLNLLDDLTRQTHQPQEVFVIDASPGEDQLTQEDLSRYPAWLCYSAGHPQGNVSRQRNSVLHKCAGEIILFLDDDVEFGPDLIANYLDAFHETGADGISGIVLLPNENLSKSPKHVKAIPVEYPGSPNYQAVDAVLETHVICTASFAVSRSSLLEVGGFDEQLGGLLDDVDLGIRLKKKGFRILHHNRPQLLHLKVPASGSRSSELGFKWAVTNLFYFQFRHYWGERRSFLLARTLWDYCHPSRHWLTPGYVRKRWTTVTGCYREAVERVSAGPKLLAPAPEMAVNSTVSVSR
jgi:GT2 family glycosyltransferase